jgi:hypothetical protein
MNHTRRDDMSEATMALWRHLCRLVPVSLRIQERHRQLARSLAGGLQGEGLYAALAPTVTTGLVMRLAIERGLDDMAREFTERRRERIGKAKRDAPPMPPAPT